MRIRMSFCISGFNPPAELFAYGEGAACISRIIQSRSHECLRINRWLGGMNEDFTTRRMLKRTANFVNYKLYSSMPNKILKLINDCSSSIRVVIILCLAE